MVITILQRDPRCTMITLEPETGVSNPEVLQQVTEAHDGTVGVYGAVLVEGMLRRTTQLNCWTKSSHTTLAHWVACVTV